MTSNTAPSLAELQQSTWKSSLPLCIRLAPGEARSYDKADPYLIHVPRLTYLPFLLPRLRTFFAQSLIDDSDAVGPEEGWFSFEGVPLKWHYPVGLLYDLFSGAANASEGGNQGQGREDRQSRGPQSDRSYEKAGLPWELELHFSDWPEEQLVRLDAEGRVMEDAFINGVKEADFLRYGTAKGIMSLSKEDSTQLWKSVQTNDFFIYNSIHQKLLNPAGPQLRNIPIKIYLPSSASEEEPPTEAPEGTESPGAKSRAQSQASLRVIQAPVSPMYTEREVQTLGTALHALLPTLFPSRRTPTLARPVLHGVALPLAAPLEEVSRSLAYLDGWVHLCLVMMG